MRLQISILFCLGLIWGQFCPQPAAFAQSADQTVIAHRVISVLTGDWNQDGDFDRALLVLSNEATETELHIYLSNAQSEEMSLVLKANDFVWHGGLWGTHPRLELGPQDSLVVIAQNDSIGRNRWRQKITLSYQKNNQQFLISQYQYDAWDTLDLDYEMSCSLNFAHGQGLKNGQVMRFAPSKIPANTWHSGRLPTPCQD